MENKRFTKNDNGFICENCGHEVLPLGYTSRNHCPKCLASKHVDVLPGDRQNTCGGVMDAIKVEPDPKKGSSTRSPGFELARINFASNFSGFWVGWGVFSGIDQ